VSGRWCSCARFASALHARRSRRVRLLGFAVARIPAHTLSSFNLHTDYRRPQDEARSADPEHLAAVIEAAIRDHLWMPPGNAPGEAVYDSGSPNEPVARASCVAWCPPRELLDVRPAAGKTE